MNPLNALMGASQGMQMGRPDREAWRLAMMNWRGLQPEHFRPEHFRMGGMDPLAHMGNPQGGQMVDYRQQRPNAMNFLLPQG